MDNDIYIVVAAYDKGPDVTGVSLFAAFHTQKEAEQYRETLAYKITGEMFNTTDHKKIQQLGSEELEWNKEMLFVERIKGVYPCEKLVIDGRRQEL